MLQLLYFEQDANGGYGLGLQVFSMFSFCFSFCSTCTWRSLCIAFCRLCCVILKERKTEVPFFSPLGYHLYLFEMIFQIRKRKGKLRKLCLIIIANLILDRHVIDSLMGMNHALISIWGLHLPLWISRDTIKRTAGGCLSKKHPHGY